MIDVSPFIDKLEALKVYTHLRIENTLPVNICEYGISIDMGYLPSLPPDRILEIWYATGTMYYRGDYTHSQVMRPPTFDEWYNTPTIKQRQ